MPSPVAPHLDNYLGALFIGVMLSTAIYGVTCLQYYLYFAHYSSRDGRFIRALIMLLLVLDTVHAAFLGICYYYYSVTHFGDQHALEKPHWSLLVQVGVGTVMSLIVQCFYAYRIHRLGNAIVVPLIIVALSLGQEIAGGIMYMLRAFQVDTIPLKASASSIAFTTAGLVCDVACDICIAVANITYLYQKAPDSLRTNRAIGQLIMYSMNTCLVTSICASVCLIVWMSTSQTSLIYAPFFFIMIRLYSCSMMTIMNSRENVRKTLRESSREVIGTAKVGSNSRTWGTWGSLRDTVHSGLPASHDGRFPRGDIESQFDRQLSPPRPPVNIQMTYWSVPQTVSTTDSIPRVWGDAI